MGNRAREMKGKDKDLNESQHLGMLGGVECHCSCCNQTNCMSKSDCFTKKEDVDKKKPVTYVLMTFKVAEKY